MTPISTISTISTPYFHTYFHDPYFQAVAFAETAYEIVLPALVEVEPGAILRLAEVRKLSVYDAEFLGLAMALGVKLVTLDAGILKAAPGIGISPEAFGGPPGK